MRRRKMNPVVIIIGIIIAIALAVGIQLILPASVPAGVKRILFFLTVVISYFIVVFVSSLISRR